MYHKNDDWFFAQEKHFLNIDEYNTSDSLVIHPFDPSTTFLSAIYEQKHFDIVNDPFVNQDQIVQLIETHKRIICLGHGSPFGLFGGYEFLLHDGLSPILKHKELVSIWCHADQFMRVHRLNGFFCGMFVSEVGEADLYNIPYQDNKEIEISNNLFASVLGKYIDSAGDNILELVQREYHDENNPVITFNRNGLYYNGTARKVD